MFRPMDCSKFSHMRNFRLPPWSALFGGITQRRAVIPYRRFGITYRSNLQGSTADPKHWQGITALRCVTLQKSADLSHMSLTGYKITEYTLCKVTEGSRQWREGISGFRRGVGGWLPTFRDDLSVASSNVQ